MNKNSHLTFEKYVAPIFGILWNWIFYYCVYYFLCNTDKMQGSGPPSHLSQGDHAKYDIILDQSEHENFFNHLHNDTKPVLSWVSIHKICNPQQPIHFAWFFTTFYRT